VAYFASWIWSGLQGLRLLIALLAQGHGEHSRILQPNFLFYFISFYFIIGHPGV
jgi:hypothetical protein